MHNNKHTNNKECNRNTHNDTHVISNNTIYAYVQAEWNVYAYACAYVHVYICIWLYVYVCIVMFRTRGREVFRQGPSSAHGATIMLQRIYH